MSIAIVVCVALLALLDVPTMLRNRDWKAIVVYGITILAGLVILVLYSIGIMTPSPLKLFDSVFKAVFSPLYMDK